MEQQELQRAIKAAMQTEKDAMDYYKYGAEKMADPKARQSFEILANEEKQHAHMFFNIYKGDDVPSFDAFISAPPNTESSWWKSLQQALLADFDERKAIELAIEQEEALEKDLLAMAAKINDADVKAVYLANARSTHNHYELCVEEYNALLGKSS
ncbi:ferritin-like domain-containing protein [Desulfuromonas thiophila]|jgi:rubrerythrin|uniref:Rubrerythrin n=1 Tax=Desulfuromonas thiophila TaxID=57664 RepID=A0A1G7DTX1_9BACT|nr:ferritin family protein [Desulfuromonas thiophila]MCK9172620.1 ferritin family protein [Desulfuromonas thiophila]MDY0397668.1 ferritin family protein [Desulfuromonas thiophila]SDE54979.1 Rubrerythrin [Desulfuromonas thiophila]